MNKISFLLMIIVVGVVFACQAQRPFALYQPIIDKYPFGPPPDDPAVIPDKVPNTPVKDVGNETREQQKEQEKLEKAVSVSAIISKPNGSIMVGFSDSSAGKTPTHYYLAEGESKNGWFVKSVNVADKKVVLEKDSIEIERVLGDKSVASVPVAPNANQTSTPNNTSPNRLGSGSLLSRRPGAFTPMGDNNEPKSRRQIRMDEKAAADAREADRKRAEAEAAARRAKEDAERAAERAEIRQQLQDMRDALRNRREEGNNMQQEQKQEYPQGVVAPMEG